MRNNYSIRVFNQLAIKTTKALNVRVFYCLKGKCKITINLQMYNLCKDEIAFVLLNDTYSLESVHDSTCCVIDIPFELYIRLVKQSMLSSGLKIDNDEKNRVKFWILRLLEMHCMQKIDKSEANKLILYLLIELSHFKDTDVTISPKMYLSENIHEYLVNHHDSKINKQDLANAVKLSNQTLTSMFKETPFQTFNQYLNHLRLKFCLNDILTTHRPIEEIAIDHGFHHYSRFIQLFKETYGKTPKLIRKDYIATSIFQNESEEIDLNRHILNSLNELKDTTSFEIEERKIKVSESHIKYSSPDFYIKHISNSYFDQVAFLNMKRLLRINKGTIYYIVELNYNDISREREIFMSELSLLLQFVSDLNMYPIFKVSTKRNDVFNSTEKMSFNQALEILFVLLRQFNHLHLGFLTENATINLINQLKQMINRYFDDYQLIYCLKEEQFKNIDLTLIQTKVDKVMLPIKQLIDTNIDKSKVIIEVAQVVKNKETLLSEELLHLFKFMLQHYDNISGLLIPYSEQYVRIRISHQELNAFQLLSYILSMLNQLRGNIVYRSNEMIVTRYKHEYQGITYFMNTKSKMSVDQYRLIFSDIKQLSHADIESINIKRYVMNENASLDSLMLYQQNYWLAKLNCKEITKSSIDIPKNSIAHIKFLISS